MGYDVEIFVPGSRHMDTSKGWPEDKVSLSTAGLMYLAGKGVPPSTMHGEDLIDKYKGPLVDVPYHGVYGAADECYVTGEYFKEQQKFGLIVSVVSPFQVPRKQLHYIANGVKAIMEPAHSSEYHHNPENEIKTSLPSVINAEDPTFQEKDTPLQEYFRNTRCPLYATAARLSAT